MFQTAGLVHPRLRTLMLPHALWSRRGRRSAVVIGHPIDSSSFEHFPGDKELAQYLRMRTLILGRRRRPAPPSESTEASLPPAAPIPPPARPDRIAGELSVLSVDSRLVEAGPVTVFLAIADEIPESLGEIGRLREVAFRASGEGTGRSRDLDRFDAYYRHLFAYDHEQRRILGAYRVGRTDEILPRLGAGGLYSSTLFRYEEEFLGWIDPGLELGRSFVVPDAQRSTRTLQLLWRGIGAFVHRHPRYRRLFGPVSISRDYADATRRILMNHLSTHHRDAELAQWVRPRRPPRRRGPSPRLEREVGRLCRVRDVSSVIRELEADARDVPVLVREYLKLGGRILAFNEDREFANVIDGLVVVDLADSPPARLRKYMGDAGAERFLAIHSIQSGIRSGIRSSIQSVEGVHGGPPDRRPV